MNGFCCHRFARSVTRRGRAQRSAAVSADWNRRRVGAWRQMMALGLIVITLGATIVRAEVAADIIAEACGDRIVRYFASAEDRAAGLPSLALQRPLPATGPAPAGFPVQPAFQRIAGRFAARFDIQPGTSLYGTGEVAGPLLRNGVRVTAWNHDAYGYDERTLHLYQAHPWVLAVRADGSAYGILADTSYRCHIDLSQGILFVADGPAFPLLVIDRDSPQEVLRALAGLIATIPLPPKWALGYHQCRYSYNPDSRVREIADEFRARQIPCDVIWLDIDYMDGYRCFTFSPYEFPKPRELTDYLHAQHFHTVAIIDPGIKREPGYHVYDSGEALGAWVETRLGDVYTGQVWPGYCVFPDFTRARVRNWWADLYGPFLALGIDGVWNDMNEPAIFNVDSKTMPLDNVHHGDRELGGTGPHARYHNVYGMLMARATREGVLRARPDRRPFVLSRANFIGGQRYAVAWTGDNTASWSHLDFSIPMVLNLGLSGQPFAGPDIGGFIGPGSGRQFARWMGIGALQPFARGHTGKGNVDKEPWAFGPEVEATCRLALQRRYRLMPHLYTLFWEASRTGLPVNRPVFFVDPAAPALRAVDDAFLLGAGLLVVAQVTPNADRQVTMPAGIWRRFDLGLGDGDDPELPALYLRGGSILPLGPVLAYVDEVPTDPLELVVCLDEDGLAEGLLYEDDGVGHGHRKGDFSLVRFRARLDAGVVTVSSEVEDGDRPREVRRWKVRLLLEDREVTGEGDNSEVLRLDLAGR